MTEGCNLNCDFCFQQETKRTNKQLTNDEIIKFTNFILKHCIIEDTQDFSFNIIGGEPMLFKNFSIFKTVIDMYYKKYNKINEITVFTNGTIYNESFIEFCNYVKDKVNKIVITINENYFDDIPNRIYKSQQDKFKIVVNRLKKELSFVQFNIVPIFDKNIKDSYKRILEYNLTHKNIKIINFAEYSTSDKNLTEKDFYNFTKEFLTTLKEKNINIFKTTFNIGEVSGLKYLNLLLNKNIDINKASCRPLVKEFGISPKGYMCPCSRALAFKNEFPNIHEDENIIIDKLKKYMNKNMSLQTLNEERQDCFKCLLKINCLSCKIMPFGYIENEGIFYVPKEKCEYQLAQFNGQYNAFKDFLEEEFNWRM